VTEPTDDLVVLESDLLSLGLPENAALVARARERVKRLSEIEAGMALVDKGSGEPPS
jgi:hypothetical protein